MTASDETVAAPLSVELRLTQSMQLGRFALYSMQIGSGAYERKGMSAQAPLGSVEKKLVACLLNQSHAQYDSLFAGWIKEHAPPKDVKVAQAFFDGPIGRKYAELSFWKMVDELGFDITPSSADRPELNPEEKSALRQYERTSAALTLSFYRILHDQGLADALGRKNEAIVQGCVTKAKTS